MSRSSSASPIAMVLAHRVGLGTAIPYSKALIDAGRAVNLYCLGDFDSLAEKVMPAEVGVIPRAEFQVPARRSRAINTAVYGLSSLYPGVNPDQRQSFEHRNGAGADWRRRIISATKRVDPRHVNRLASACSPLLGTALKERDIWVISSLHEPSLALAPKARVVTLIDSWDHPVRRTAGYRTDIVVGWNRDLAMDWVQFQGASVALAGAPLKLKYAADVYPQDLSERPVLMFAVGTSTYSPEWQKGEMRLAELVFQAASDAGWGVVLKLKPTGGQEEWLALGAQYPDVSVSSAPGASGATDYFLDSEYNLTRLRELSGVRLVVNTVTTFGLDAACAGIPVLQLAGLGGSGLSGLASAQRNYHLQKYLLSEPDAVMWVDEDNVRQRLKQWLLSPDRLAASYSAKLRDWLLPEEGFERAIERAVLQALDR